MNQGLIRKIAPIVLLVGAVALMAWVIVSRLGGDDSEREETSLAIATQTEPERSPPPVTTPLPESRAIPERSVRAASLGDALAEIENAWGLGIENVAGLDADRQLELDVTDAGQALKSLADQLGVALIGNWSGSTTGRATLTGRALYAGDDEEVLKLLEDLESDSAETRADAIEELAERTDENTEPLVIAMLAPGEDEEVKISAAIGLEESQSSTAVDALISALADVSLEVREHARATLGLLGGEDVVEKLRQARAATTDPEVIEIIDQLLEQVFDEPLPDIED